MYHDIIHDTGHEQVVDDIVSWIASRAEDAPVTPIPEDLGTPRFFPEEKKKLGSVRSKLSGSVRLLPVYVVMRRQRGLCEVVRL